MRSRVVISFMLRFVSTRIASTAIGNGPTIFDATKSRYFLGPAVRLFCSASDIREEEEKNKKRNWYPIYNIVSIKKEPKNLLGNINAITIYWNIKSIKFHYLCILWSLKDVEKKIFCKNIFFFKWQTDRHLPFWSSDGAKNRHKFFIHHYKNYYKYWLIL